MVRLYRIKEHLIYLQKIICSLLKNNYSGSYYVLIDYKIRDAFEEKK